MYFISILAVILATLVTCFSGSSSISYLLDVPSLMMILLICIPILISSGLFRDFNNAFCIVLGRGKDNSLITIKRAIEAVTLMIKILLYSGLFVFLLTIIVLLKTLDDPGQLGSNLAVAILTFVYAIGMVIILLPVKSILTVRMIEFMSEHEEETLQKEEMLQKEETE